MFFSPSPSVDALPEIHLWKRSDILRTAWTGGCRSLAPSLTEISYTLGTSHLANSISNLTYISEELNSCFGGLGEVMVDLTLEDPASLWAHMLQASKTVVQDEFLEDYRRLRESFSSASPAPSTDLRKTFDNMTKRRRERLSVAFRMCAKRSRSTH